MFWSDKKQGYELPFSKQQESTQKDNTTTRPNITGSSKPSATKSNLTNYSCPVCAQPLELYEYTKENQLKQMLRCSDAIARQQDDHKNVAYFAAKGGFWSPTYGEIDKEGNSQKSTKTGNRKRVGKQSHFNKPAATKACVQIPTPKASSLQAWEEHPAPCAASH